ncbi:hypothetical protein ANAPH1_00078 [Anaplasma phagocytophilum]|nr:hypothetical protein ANAPH1_00078 [Anaplasma phagocytophilum]
MESPVDPAPTSMCNSSINSMILPLDRIIFDSTALRRSSNSPRYLVPATNAAKSSDNTLAPCSPMGTFPETIDCTNPSTIALLPTPGSPIRAGLFFVLRESTCMRRLVSSLLPITGSILPSVASSVRSCVNFLRASNFCSAVSLSALSPSRIFSIRVFSFVAVTPAFISTLETLLLTTTSACNNLSAEMYASPFLLAMLLASSRT